MSRYSNRTYRGAGGRGGGCDACSSDCSTDDESDCRGDGDDDCCCARPISAESQDGKFVCCDRFKRKFSKMRLTEAFTMNPAMQAKLKAVKGFNAFTYVQCLLVCGEDAMLTRDDLRAIRKKQLCDGVCVLVPTFAQAEPSAERKAIDDQHKAKLAQLEEASLQAQRALQGNENEGDLARAVAIAAHEHKQFKNFHNNYNMVNVVCRMKFVRVTLRCKKDIDECKTIADLLVAEMGLKAMMHFVPLLPLLIVNERAYDTWQSMKCMAKQKKDVFGEKHPTYKNCADPDLVEYVPRNYVVREGEGEGGGGVGRADDHVAAAANQ